MPNGDEPQLALAEQAEQGEVSKKLKVSDEAQFSGHSHDGAGKSLARSSEIRRVGIEPNRHSRIFHPGVAHHGGYGPIRWPAENQRLLQNKITKPRPDGGIELALQPSREWNQFAPPGRAAGGNQACYWLAGQEVGFTATNTFNPRFEVFIIHH